MTDPNRDILKKFKNEADELLFDQLDFHEGLKDKVRKNSRQSAKQKVILPFWKRPIFAAISVAAVFTLVLVSTLFIREPETGDLPIHNTFLGDDESMKLISEPQKRLNKELGSMEEVKQVLSGDVLVPTYTPEGFELDRIQANGVENEKAHQVVLTYSSNEQTYIAIIQKTIERFEPQGFEHVDINGAKGYLKTEGSAESLNTELQWYEGDYHYMVSGVLTPEEAIKVATSFK